MKTFLSCYFPYKLKCLIILELDEKQHTVNELIGMGEEQGFFENDMYWLNQFKPILKPISELTKEEVNSFSVGVRLELRKGCNINQEVLLSRISYYELHWLLERHFDIFGLIEKDLAIDINTLNK